MALAPADIVNRAIELIGNNVGGNGVKPISGNLPTFDGSATGIAAGILYPEAVQTVAREFGWDFSRNIVPLQLTGNQAPLGYTFEYAYPTNGIQVRQIVDPAQADPNDPLPIRWTVGNTGVNGILTKVIWCSVTNAKASFTNQPPEATWDPGFTAAVVRFLASGLAMALMGRPETQKDMAQASATVMSAAEARDS